MSSQNRSLWKAQFTARKLTFYFLFHGFHVLVFILGWRHQALDPRLAVLNELNFSVWFSRGSALVLTVDMMIIVLPMCRNILTFIRPRIRWLPLDESQWFHRQIAHSLLFWTIVHVSSHYVNFFNVERYQLRKVAAVQIHYHMPAGITGHIMLLCMFLIFTTSHQKIRQQSFETFWYTHHLFIIMFLALFNHATGCFVRDSIEPVSPFAGKAYWTHCIGYLGWRWELPAVFLYFCERIYREVRSRRQTEIIKVVKHPFDAVEIQFRKPSMAYKPGQWVFLNVPSVAYHEWHPFTITSCPFDPYVSIHIRQVGDFTRAFADAIGAGPHQAELYDTLDPLGMYEIALDQGQVMPSIRIDGPYGAPAEDVFENEVAVLIGTGIGVTPWASVLKNIYNLRMRPDPPRRLRRVEFIWICRDTTSFEWFQALLSSLEGQSLALSGRDSKGATSIEFLRIHTYLTQALDIDTAQNIVLNSVGANRDPLTELNSRTNFGRPDWRRLLGGMRDGLIEGTYLGEDVGRGRKSKNEVGVYFCGPNAAAREIRKACHDATVDRVKFKFWKEHY
ncbi:hypothetical protein ANO11243_054300 [Dothideomycetidae sp. 11243]|nr:hypothetical protein ANO11243_054300 [fungal sp. No.11243]